MGSAWETLHKSWRKRDSHMNSDVSFPRRLRPRPFQHLRCPTFGTLKAFVGCRQTDVLTPAHGYVSHTLNSLKGVIKGII